MGLFETANELSILQAGNNPEWIRQSVNGNTLEEDTDTPSLLDGLEVGPPSLSSQGVSLNDGISTLVSIQLRETPAYRTCYLTVDTLDTGATYTITINGSDIATSTPTTADDLLVDLKAAILVNAVVGQAAATPIINASLYDSTGAATDGTAAGDAAATTLKIVGEAADDYTIDISATGSGVLACTADLMQADIRLWALYDGVVGSDIPTQWSPIKDAEYSVDYRGISERLDTAGIDRIYVEISNPAAGGDGDDIVYSPRLSIGPSVL